MDTQSVNLKTPERCRGLKQALNHAMGDVAMAEEAHAHYGETFGRVAKVQCWLLGFLEGLKKFVITPQVKKIGSRTV